MSTSATPGVHPGGCGQRLLVDSSNTCLDNVGPFSNLQPYSYWSSATPYAPNPFHAWFLDVDDGLQGDDVMTDSYLVWAVSLGDVGVVPEAETWAMLLAGLGLVGVAARRRRG